MQLVTKRTDQCFTFCFILPLCPTDRGIEYYECENCKYQAPTVPVAAPFNLPQTAAPSPPSQFNPRGGPYNHYQPQRPLPGHENEYTQQHLYPTTNVNNSSVYPGNRFQSTATSSSQYPQQRNGDGTSNWSSGDVGSGAGFKLGQSYANNDNTQTGGTLAVHQPSAPVSVSQSQPQASSRHAVDNDPTNFTKPQH